MDDPRSTRPGGRDAAPSAATDRDTAGILLRGAVNGARATLDSFERHTASPMDEMTLLQWVGEFRAVLLVLVEAVERSGSL